MSFRRGDNVGTFVTVLIKAPCEPWRIEFKGKAQ